jgi:hypothetical protein
MQLFDDYVRWLRFLLPKAQREDIIRELSEEYRSLVAEKEAELGRPLTREEHAGIIAQFGHPLLTAARYWPSDYLVGPMLFPFYWPVLKALAAVVVVVHVLSAIVMALNGAAALEIVRELALVVRSGLVAFAWATIAFALFERALVRSRVLERWNPLRVDGHAQHLDDAMLHTAGAVHHAMGAVHHAVGGMHEVFGGLHRRVERRSRASSMSRLIMATVISVWWIAALKYPVLMFGGGARYLDWGPDMMRLFPVLIVAQITLLVGHFGRVTLPEAGRFFRITRIVWMVNGALFLYFLLTLDRQWVIWRGEAPARLAAVLDAGGRPLSLVDVVNYAFTISFVFAAVAGLSSVTWRLFRGGRGPAVPLAATLLLAAPFASAVLWL